MFDPARVGRDLDRARRAYGGRNWPASFADRLTSPLPGARDVARMLRERRQANVDVSARVPVEPLAAVPEHAAGRASATWIGHATVVVRIGGKTILTDPVWSSHIPGVRNRLVPPAITLDQIGHIDAVVISHNHFDHLDAPTIRRIPRRATMFVPGMLGAWFRRRNFTSVVELDWWETARLGAVAVSFVPAHHWSRRGLNDTCKTLWGGWVLTSEDASVYFAGDTGYGHWFADIGARHPGIDLALMPVGAYEPSWFMRPVHLNPEEAVRACQDLGAARMAAMHWGTFQLSAEPILEPPARAEAAWRAAGLPPDGFYRVPIGGSVIL